MQFRISVGEKFGAHNNSIILILILAKKRMSTSSPAYPDVYIGEAPTPVNNEHRVANEYALSH
ncbi:MAG TPA: hypothetical protein VKA09_11435 [Nitrososphaeraceae archaeon]|nr:hypothetical protein [Nitrososphaeraceae archaeon]